jgi:hypothetical protein
VEEGGMNEYETTRRVVYNSGAQFVPVCIKCGRYVKADDHITLNGLDELVIKDNATCSKCGRTLMIFEGFVELEE